ncbi:phage holin [[Clostridium] aminophilum]|uniref:phage holin n=1 Tax=[Clostridium] aminophilum TaxID=1526 RepID=UPI0026E9511B|nr:phage holin [[Clostridium] aminophilum]
MNLELNDKTYNVLKWAGLIAIPALGVFVGTVGPVWGLPQTDAIVTTLNALGTLIGALICVSSVSYNKKGE